MPGTTSCKRCGTLVWDYDIPSKKTGNCQACEIKRLTEENRQLRVKAERLTELYESAILVIRRLQGEREGFIDRVHAALIGIANV